MRAMRRTCHSRRRRSASPGSRPRSPRSIRFSSCPAWSRSRRCSSACRRGRRGCRAGRAADRGRCRARSASCSTSSRAWRVTEDGFRSKSVNWWLLGEMLRGRVRHHGGRWTAGVRGVSAARLRLTVVGEIMFPNVPLYSGERGEPSSSPRPSALTSRRAARRRRLPRAGGTGPSSRAIRGRGRHGLRRGRLHNGHDRLPGDGHRSELLRAARCFTTAMVGNYRMLWFRRGVSRASHMRVQCSSPHSAETTGPAGSGEHGLVGLDGIDTRSLVLRLRDAGAMRAAVVSDESSHSVEDALAQARMQPSMEGQALVEQVSTREPYVFAEAGDPHIAVVDYGAKRSIMRRPLPREQPLRSSHTRPRRTSSRATTESSLERPGDAEPLAAETEIVRDLSAARPSSESASGISCSASRPDIARTSFRSVTAARTIPCSSAGRDVSSSPARTTASRSRRPRAARRRTCRSTTAPSRA